MFEKIIIELLKKGYTQNEISNELKKRDIKPNSLGSVENKMKELRKLYKSKTNFQLAVQLVKFKKIKIV